MKTADASVSTGRRWKFWSSAILVGALLGVSTSVIRHHHRIAEEKREVANRLLVKKPWINVRLSATTLDQWETFKSAHHCFTEGSEEEMYQNPADGISGIIVVTWECDDGVWYEIPTELCCNTKGCMDGYDDIWCYTYAKRRGPKTWDRR